jgi:molybdopterin synthase catalytic subunit
MRLLFYRQSPVVKGIMGIAIRVQANDFNLGAEYDQLRSIIDGLGAIVTFTGLVRDFESYPEDPQCSRKLTTLTLQHYPEMTERLLAEIVEQALARWSLLGVTIIHRIGSLSPNDQIVFVGVASTHRQDAFQAAEFLMDYLKTRATFWKKAHVDGQEQWLDAKHSDANAAARWDDIKHD